MNGINKLTLPSNVNVLKNKQKLVDDYSNFGSCLILKLYCMSKNRSLN